MTPLREIIASLLSGQGLPFCMEDARIWEAWSQAMKEVSECACPVSFQKGVLRIEVSEPIWMQELKFLENQIKGKLNHTLGERVIKKIEFRLKRE